MRESALRDGIGVEIYVLDFALDFVAVHVDNGIATVLHLHDVVVVEIHHLLRVVDNGRNVTRKEEVAFVPDAEDERGAAACADKRTRFVAGDDGEAERPFDFGDGLEYGGLEVAGVETCNQVRHNFGIGLGLEFDPVGDELGLEACVVLDDAVVDNGNLAVVAHVRVRVLDGRSAVRGPAGVCDADGALWRVHLELVFKFLDLAGSLYCLDGPVVNKGDTRTVVTAIFQFLEPADENGQGFVCANIGDNSAHNKSFKR